MQISIRSSVQCRTDSILEFRKFLYFMKCFYSGRQFTFEIAAPDKGGQKLLLQIILTLFLWQSLQPAWMWTQNLRSRQMRAMVALGPHLQLIAMQIPPVWLTNPPTLLCHTTNPSQSSSQIHQLRDTNTLAVMYKSRALRHKSRKVN